MCEAFQSLRYLDTGLCVCVFKEYVFVLEKQNLMYTISAQFSTELSWFPWVHGTGFVQMKILSPLLFLLYNILIKDNNRRTVHPTSYLYCYLSVWTVLTWVAEFWRYCLQSYLPFLEFNGTRCLSACRAQSAKNTFEKLHSNVSFQKSLLGHSRQPTDRSVHLLMEQRQHRK